MVNDDDAVQPPPVPAPPAPPQQQSEPAAPAVRRRSPGERRDALVAGARRAATGARRHVAWIAVGVLAAIVVLTLVVGRLAPDPETQSADAVAAWDADLAAHRATVLALTNQGALDVTSSAVDESGLATGDLLQQTAGIDLQSVVSACGSADAATRLSAAAVDLRVPVLGAGLPDSEEYLEAQREADQFARELAAAESYADDVAALDGSLGAACDLAASLLLPVSYLQYRNSPIAEGEQAQVSETTTVVCAGAYGCPTGPGASPTYDWGSLADSHREVAAAFGDGCPVELEASCALAITSLEGLAADDDAVLTAWAAANDATSTPEQLQALQAALDDRADRFATSWAAAQAAAPGGDLEGALATILADGLDELGELVDGIQIGDPI